MTLDVIARPPSLVEKVCNQLAQIVRRDRHEDDGWLPTERELSEQLGVSRSVVREACASGRYNGIVLLGGGDPGFPESREIGRRHGIPVTAIGAGYFAAETEPVQLWPHDGLVSLTSGPRFVVPRPLSAPGVGCVK